MLGSHSFKLFFSSATLAVSARAQAQIAFQEPFDTPETVYRSCLDMQAFQREVLQVWRLELISLADAPRILSLRSFQVAAIRTGGDSPGRRLA